MENSINNENDNVVEVIEIADIDVVNEDGTFPGMDTSETSTALGEVVNDFSPELDLTQEQLRALQYVFVVERNAIKAELTSLRSKVVDIVSRYISEHKIVSLSLQKMVTDAYITPIMFYLTAYQMSPVDIQRLLAARYIAEQTKDESNNYLNESNFSSVILAVQEDISVLVSAVVECYSNTRLQRMHERFNQLFVYLEYPLIQQLLSEEENTQHNKVIALLKMTDVSKMRAARSAILSQGTYFKTVFKEIYGAPISQKLLNMTEYLAARFQGVPDLVRKTFPFNVITKEGTDVVPFVAYTEFLVHQYYKMMEKGLYAPVVVYDLLKEIDATNSHGSDDILVSKCVDGCDGVLDFTDMAMEFNVRRKVSEMDSLQRFEPNYDRIPGTLDEDLLRMVDDFLISGWVYQYHKVCPKCGRIHVLSERDNKLMKEYLKAFLKDEPASSSENLTSAYGTLSTEVILDLESKNPTNNLLSMAIEIEDKGVDTVTIADPKFNDILRLSKDFVRKLKLKQTNYIISEVKSMPIDEGYVARDKLYKNFLLWFIETNCSTKLPKENLIKIGLNYYYGQGIQNFQKQVDSLENEKKIYNLFEVKNNQLLESYGLLDRESSPDYEPIIEEQDIFSEGSVDREVTILTSLLLRAIADEAADCLYKHTDDITIAKIAFGYKKLLESEVAKSSRNSVYFNALTGDKIIDTLTELVYNDTELLNYADITNGTIHNTEEYSEQKLMDKYIPLVSNILITTVTEFMNKWNPYEYTFKSIEYPEELVIKSKDTLLAPISDKVISKLLIKLGVDSISTSSENNLAKLVADLKSKYASEFAVVKQQLAKRIISLEDVVATGDKIDSSLETFANYLFNTVRMTFSVEDCLTDSIVEYLLNTEVILRDKLPEELLAYNNTQQYIDDFYENRLDSYIMYNIRLACREVFNQKSLASGVTFLKNKMHIDFEDIAIKLLQIFKVHIEKPRFFNGNFITKKKSSELFPAKALTDNPQFKPSNYALSDEVRFAFSTNANLGVSELSKVLWYYIKIMDVNSYLEALDDSLSLIERNMEDMSDDVLNTLGNRFKKNQNNVVQIDELFSRFYKLPLNVLSRSLDDIFEEKLPLEAGNNELQADIENFKNLILEKSEYNMYYYLLGLKPTCGYGLSKDKEKVLLNTKIDKFAYSNTVIPMLISNQTSSKQ